MEHPAAFLEPEITVNEYARVSLLRHVELTIRPIYLFSSLQFLLLLLVSPDKSNAVRRSDYALPT